ncbi:MAG: hypothetical protein ACFFA6_07805 [Promethearchaeota archaeon]
MGSQTDNKKSQEALDDLEKPQDLSIQTNNNFDSQDPSFKNLENIMDENLVILKKVHSILLNCINLTKKQKLEFAESERYFMKLYLKRLTSKINNQDKILEE